MHPVNTVTNGLKKFDRIIKRLTLLTRVIFFTRKCMAVCRAATKSGRNNEVAVGRGSTVLQVYMSKEHHLLVA